MFVQIRAVVIATLLISPRGGVRCCGAAAGGPPVSRGGVVGPSLCMQCADKAPGDLVFPGRDGDYLGRPDSLTGWFVAAVKRAAVQSITPHDLRHTCASLAVSARVNVLALQRMPGHKSAAMTLDTCADLFDTDLDGVADTLHARYTNRR